ncbi:TolC family protein [Pantoea sp. Pa-EAmG]|uniref:TolC family protein n=1 Tax=Pantoea sp. Pa-EAmG TaxID=3043311 RepID=UPI0024AFE471|nr:TolC family protein [Pantoea sp. Pa-EAmG]MDI6958274.1 TolC family protein [Pantoea sp. Pa-EAmG]
MQNLKSNATLSRPVDQSPRWTRSTASASRAPLPKTDSASGADIRALLARAVNQAVRISPRLSNVRYQAEAAQGNVDEAKGQRWPQVDVTSSSQSLYFGSGNRPSSGKNDVVSFGVNMATTLYDFGQTSNTIRAREDQASAADAAISAEAESLALDVSAALLERHKQQLIISISEDYVRRMKSLTDMLSGIVDVDQGRRSELTQARGRLLSAQASLDSSVAKARDQDIVLQRLLGHFEVSLPPGSEWGLSVPDGSKLASQIPNNPLILKALAEARAARSEAEAVRSSGLPKINWVVSKNTGQDELGRRQAFQTGVQVSWGIFRGGSGSAAERAALARAEASMQSVEEQRRDSEQRIHASLQDAEAQLERAALYHNLTAETDRIRLAFFEQWYHLGKRTLLDVLSAESDYYNNRVSEVSSRVDGYASLIRGYANAGMLIKWLGQRVQ